MEKTLTSMPTAKQRLAAARRECGLGSLEGSCFGTFDESRLRDSLRTKRRIPPPQVFEEGKKYFLIMSLMKSYFQKIELQDVVLADDFQASVTVNFDDTNPAQVDWAKNKLPYTDLETKTVQYIHKEF